MLNTKAKKNRQRVGRGISAGQGKTAGRGTKGQASRSGYSTKPNFEGGQTPLIKRLPKLKGFISWKQPAQEVKVGDLTAVKGKTVNAQTLQEAGLVTDSRFKIKLILGTQQLKEAKNVEVQAASASAEAAIKDAGGSLKIVDVINFNPKPAPKAAKK